MKGLFIFSESLLQSFVRDVKKVRCADLVYPLLVAAVILIFTTLQPWLSMANATRDAVLVAAALKDEALIPFAGFVSNIGIAFWVSASAICFFAASRLRHDQGWTPGVTFLTALAVQSFIFAFDDLFMIHDRVAPNHDIRERYVYAVLGTGYLVVLGIYIARRQFATSALLIIASVAFFVSTAFDKFGTFGNSQMNYLAEDGAKLVGILYWLTFCVRSACMESSPQDGSKTGNQVAVWDLTSGASQNDKGGDGVMMVTHAPLTMIARPNSGRMVAIPQAKRHHAYSYLWG